MIDRESPPPLDLLVLDLGKGRDREELQLPFSPVCVCVWELTGELALSVRPDGARIPVHEGDSIGFDPQSSHRIWKLYASNDPQPGKYAKLLITNPPIEVKRG